MDSHTGTGNAFFGPSSDLLNQRRASDSTALGKRPTGMRASSNRTASTSSTGGLERSSAAGGGGPLSSSAPDASPAVNR